MTCLKVAFGFLIGLIGSFCLAIFAYFLLVDVLL